VLYKEESEELMDETLRKYFKELEQYRDLSSIENEMRFSEIIDKIVLTKDPEVLPLLLKYFDDDSDSEDIAMQVLKHGIESFEIEDYISALLKELSSMLIRAPQECNSLFYRIFNGKKYLAYLKENVHLADKETLLKLLDNIENDEPLEQHKPIIAELRKLANQ
jgi:hypothetical protein